jgi:hypothetical protein
MVVVIVMVRVGVMAKVLNPAIYVEPLVVVV